MNNEIKEILDYLKRSDKNKFGFEQGKFIDYEEVQTLLDYITDLQQENKKLKRLKNKLTPEELVNMLNQELVRQNKCYKSRCEKAIEYLEKLWSFPSGNFEVAINEEENKSIDIDGNEYIDNLLNILNESDDK